MKTKNFLLSLTILVSVFGATAASPSTYSFMSDKTEIPINLEVAGAEALAQTSDGYVWIAQYSGLVRYDSKEYVSYDSFTENGQEYSIINVRALAAKDNTLYVATYNNIFTYSDYHFSCINVDAGIIKDFALDEQNDLLYICSLDKGVTLYDLNTQTSSKLPNVETGNVNDIALDVNRGSYYYQLDDGVYNSDGLKIFDSRSILDVYSHNDILYIGGQDGIVTRYNMASKAFLEEIVVSYDGKNKDQINKMLYSDKEDTLFVALNANGLCCINFSYDEPVISFASDLINKAQIVDLMIDYQGNLWIASHSSGASIITKNALTSLLYDDAVWKGLKDNKTIIAVERHEDILYIVSLKSIYLYDLNENKILNDTTIMDAINAAAGATSYNPKDVEIFNGEIYFAIQNLGLVKYNPTSKAVTVYDLDYIINNPKNVINQLDTYEQDLLNSMRSLRSFDGFLAIGYSRGIMKFDGTEFSILNISTNGVLFIDKSKDGKVMFNRTVGIYTVNDEFTEVTPVPTLKYFDSNADGSILKFLVEGDYIYYTMNSRLFRLEQANDQPVSKEIKVPFVRGSIVELSKIEYNDKNNNVVNKYIIASQTQIYITDTLDVDQLEDYEFYDSTNGLETIAANTSGYYDREAQKYYFQSNDGIFVYDFNEEKDNTIPVKVDVSSIELDGEQFFGNKINIKKDVYRVAINLSVFGFKPNKGFTIYYKMDGLDNEYHTITGDDRNINYTNLRGGDYRFHAYAIDEYGQKSNEIDIQLTKERHIYEHIWFWVIVAILAIALVVGIAFFIIRQKTKQALKKQLEYKNITVESIQAIARTIDAKDEYTNGHSTRVGYYSKLIAENLGMSEDEVDNIYYIALLHDIGKIAIPDKILNKPGRLTDEEFMVMKSHTTRGAKILRGISTIPHIIEGAKSHHEKYDGSGYPEGLKGEQIPFVARIICCADCFDAMASKRVYKEPFSSETIISEFKRCSGTQFDPKIAETVVEMMNKGILKPYSDENTYLGEDGKTHRIVKNNDDQN